MTKTEDFRLMLMNTEFRDADIDRSDIGTWYLQESGLMKLLKACKEAGLQFVNKDTKFGEFTPIDPIEVQ